MISVMKNRLPLYAHVKYRYYERERRLYVINHSMLYVLKCVIKLVKLAQQKWHCNSIYEFFRSI